jgi:hypothetical protein
MTAAGSQVSIDLRAPGVSGVPQAYTEFDFVDASGAAPANFRLRKAFGVVDLPNSARLIGGQLYTTFGAEDLRPFSIINDGTPAGAVFRRQPLLRYTVGDNVGLSRSIAIENPTSTDFTLLDPVNDTPLQRAPDLAANVRWVSPDDPMNRAQLAMLVRGFGYEDQFNSEHFLTGWGVSAMSRVRTFGDDSVQLGIVGGQGLGQYIFGFGAATDVVAAGPNPAGQLTTLPTVGAYLGYQHFLTRDIFANVAYGYAHVDTTPIMNPLSARQTQDAWANIVFALSEQLFLGIEYHYGILEVNSGATGDNHRIQTTLSYLAK